MFFSGSLDQLWISNVTLWSSAAVCSSCMFFRTYQPIRSRQTGHLDGFSYKICRSARYLTVFRWFFVQSQEIAAITLSVCTIFRIKSNYEFLPLQLGSGFLMNSMTRETPDFTNRELTFVQDNLSRTSKRL